MNPILINIGCGVIGGLIVLSIQLYIDHYKKQKEQIKNSIVGNSKLKILDSEFLYKYEPGKVSIDKIIADFGQPHRIQNDTRNDKALKIYFYIFQNAKVLITTYDKDSEVIAVTLFSTRDSKNHVLCRLSYEEDDQVLGKAKLTASILRDSFKIENQESIHEQTTVIKSKYFYRQIKHLTFAYSINGHFDKLVDANSQLIQQACVSQVESICPMIHFFDTFYS